MGKTIGVLTAMGVEFKQIASILTDTKTEKIGPHEFLVGKLGDKNIILLHRGNRSVCLLQHPLSAGMYLCLLQHQC